MHVNITSYVSDLILEQVCDDPKAYAQQFEAALLFADISGFTKLTEQLAQHGPLGAEELSGLLNDFFGRMIDLILAYGGDVVKFAGDALLAIWKVSDEQSLAVATERAAKCALAVQSQLKTSKAKLSLRIVVEAGPVYSALLGGVYGRWELMLAGQAIGQLNIGQHEAQPGEIVLSDQTWQKIKIKGQIESLKNRIVKLHSLEETVAFQPSQRIVLTEQREKLVRAYVPAAVVSRLQAGLLDWVAELRRLSIIFLNLPDLSQLSLEAAQTLIQTLQTTLYRYEGSVNKLSVDDKGTTLVAAFGLPPLSHEDDASRALQAALAMQARLQTLNIKSAIGVTTGRVFCGTIGNEKRCEYTMIGDTVNLAARLMQAAGPDRILADAATYNQTSSVLDFKVLNPITVKGKSEPIAVYQPLGVLQGRLASASDMFGRVAEIALLEACLDAMPNSTDVGLILIEGEAGIGKSRLVENFLEQVQKRKLSVLVGSSQAFEQNTPYYAWRTIFSELFGLTYMAEPQARRLKVLGWLERYPDLIELAPLLNGLLSLDLPDNELTAQLIGKVRADNIHALLCKILKVADSPQIIVLEDAHWLDSASWEVVKQIRSSLPERLVVIVTRPLSDPLPLEYTQLLQAANVQQLKLGPLSSEHILRLVCQRLGVAVLPDAVANLMLAKAEGHPFYSEELAYAMRDAGLIIVKNGQCWLAEGVEDDLQALNLPDTVQGVITSRIDRLTPNQQLTLKVASVVGRVFSHRILAGVYPIESDKPLLTEYLKILQKLDITPLEKPEPELAYIFKHIITQEVAYNLMLFAQRRDLHRAVAEWYERNLSGDLTPFYPLLAYHWQRTDDKVKAIFYLEKSGEQALRGGVYKEAINFFELALELGIDEPLRQARWERLLGQAYIARGDFKEAHEHLFKALALCGYAFPSTQRRLLIRLGSQVGQQLYYRYWPFGFKKKIHLNREARLEAARTQELLSQVYYFTSDTLPFLYVTLQGLNLIEQSEAKPELARMYVVSSVIAATIPLQALADTYASKAYETLGDTSDLATSARISTVTSIVYIGRGDWAKTIELSQKALQILKQLGDYRGQVETLSVWSLVYLYRGHFEQARPFIVEHELIAKQINSPQSRAWAMLGLGLISLRTNRSDNALEQLLQARELLTDTINRSDKMRSNSLIALAYLYNNQPKEALEQAQTVLALIGDAKPTNFFVFIGYSAVAEVYFELIQQQGIVFERRKISKKKPDLADLQTGFYLACQALIRYAKIFPIGKPRAYFFQGRYEWLIGDKVKALENWRKALALAIKLDMDQDQAMAYAELACHLPLNNNLRGKYIELARQIFSDLGLIYELEQLEANLAAHESLLNKV